MVVAGGGFDLSIVDPAERIRVWVAKYKGDESYHGFEAQMMHNLKVISAHRIPLVDRGPEATATFELAVVPALCNPMGNMHGGAVATLADMATSLAVAPVAEKGWWEFSGVSRTLGVTYVRPMPVGTTVIVECVVQSLSRRLGVIQCMIKDKATGKLLALAEHGKAALSEQVLPKAKL